MKYVIISVKLLKILIKIFYIIKYTYIYTYICISYSLSTLFLFQLNEPNEYINLSNELQGNQLQRCREWHQRDDEE